MTARGNVIRVFAAVAPDASDGMQIGAGLYVMRLPASKTLVAGASCRTPHPARGMRLPALLYCRPELPPCAAASLPTNPMPVDHYENFPVASLLLPRRLRRPIEAIYRFARQSDDLADEGDATPEQRRAALAAFDAQLLRIAAGRPPSPEPAGAMFTALALAIREHRLPIDLFRDLLSAFSQDCVVSRYRDDAGLLDYCRRSADPVGRLLLVLYHADSDTNRWRSDRICTALQWINFWQDVAVDRDKDRIYLPLADLASFGLTEAMLFGDPRALVADASWKALMRHEVTRTRAMMLEGAPLAVALPGRIGLELRMIVQGGLRILERIEAVDYDVFFRRPQLTRLDAGLIAARALAMPLRGGRVAGAATVSTIID